MPPNPSAGLLIKSRLSTGRVVGRSAQHPIRLEKLAAHHLQPGAPNHFRQVRGQKRYVAFDGQLAVRLPTSVVVSMFERNLLPSQIVELSDYWHEAMFFRFSFLHSRSPVITTPICVTSMFSSLVNDVEGKEIFLKSSLLVGKISTRNMGGKQMSKQIKLFPSEVLH